MGKPSIMWWSILACGAMAAAAFLALPRLNLAVLPVHWSSLDHADKFAPARTVLYAFPVVAAVLSAAFLLAARSPAGNGRLPPPVCWAWGLGLGGIALLQALTLLNALR